jgi:hypothetical protein
VSQLPVPLNARPAATTVPLTLMSIGRFVVVPLAYRMASVAAPASGTLTVHSTKLPVTFVMSTKPDPENPAWLVATVPCEMRAFSASYRVAALTCW